jgi:uncharacterized protein
MNRLKNESSPYLQQHASNPVDWYPWGEEALERARSQGMPILVSVGYSACHWCHVMEKESFEDERIAAYMNEHFINIKIDREERPDLDQFFMKACEALTGNGGWPLNMFLSPDGRPFFGGTYFPPEPGMRRQSWFQALQYAAYNFYENREAVEQQASRLLERLKTEGTSQKQFAHTDSDTLITHIYQQIRGQFDEEEGGFGLSAKFPNTMALEFLLHYAWYKSDLPAYRHVLHSVDRMISGGIYDQLGGGIARYAIDRQWQIPHFEKMLYDNALLAKLLSDLYKWTGLNHYLRLLQETLEFVERELRHPEGGYCTAVDADSEGEEGRYYVWTKSEIDSVLSDSSGVFCRYYGVSEGGNWEGVNILRKTMETEDLARELNRTPLQIEEALASARRKLLEARRQRPQPHRDEKILSGWNALTVTALARAFAATGQREYRDRASQALQFLFDTFLMEDGRTLRRIAVSGRVEGAAFLADYAYLIEAILEVYGIYFNHDCLRKAERLADHVLEQFVDPKSSLLFFNAADQADIPLRQKKLEDEDMPSPNMVMANNLQKLGILLDRSDYRRRASAMLEEMKNLMAGQPLLHASWAVALVGERYGWGEIAVVGPEAFETARRVNSQFLGAFVLTAAEAPNDDYPLLAHRWKEGKTYIYVCRDYSCRKPVERVEDLFLIL